MEFHSLSFRGPENLARVCVFNNNRVEGVGTVDDGSAVWIDQSQRDGVVELFRKVVAAVEFTMLFPVLVKDSLRSSVVLRQGPECISAANTQAAVKRIAEEKCPLRLGALESESATCHHLHESALVPR